MFAKRITETFPQFPFYVYSREPYLVYRHPSDDEIVSIRQAGSMLQVTHLIIGKEYDASTSWLYSPRLGYVPASSVQWLTQFRHPPSLVRKELTPDDSILTSVQWVLPDQVVQWVMPNTTRDKQEVFKIIYEYFRACQIGYINPLVAIAQSILETNFFTSFWCQKHNNFAGIGVTGEVSASQKDGYEYSSGRWVRGLSFVHPMLGIRAHVGRLMLYAYSLPYQPTDEQQRLLDLANISRSLPTALRGSASSIDGLTYRWAMDSEYGEKITAIANRILDYCNL